MLRISPWDFPIRRELRRIPGKHGAVNVQATLARWRTAYREDRKHVGDHVPSVAPVADR